MLMMHTVHHWNMRSRPAIQNNHNITSLRILSARNTGTQETYRRSGRECQGNYGTIIRHQHFIVIDFTA